VAEAGPKSAYELAMERLRRQDAEAGIEHKPLTDAQKAAITEARNLCEARLAEREVLYSSAVSRTVDPEARTTLDEEYRRDRERLTSERDSKIERIRKDASG
jgi:hypothetical protein